MQNYKKVTMVYLICEGFKIFLPSHVLFSVPSNGFADLSLELSTSLGSPRKYLSTWRLDSSKNDATGEVKS